MKTSTVLSSLLLTSLAAAAPVDRRELFTKTELVVETVVVYTTVWDGQAPASTAAAQPTPNNIGGQFHEQPAVSASSVSATSSAQSSAQPSKAPASPVVSTPAYTPPPASTPAYTPASSAPAASSVQQQPSSAAQPAQPAQTQVSTGDSSGGNGGGSYTSSLSMHDFSGNTGACGTPIQDDDLTVAIAQGAWGTSTYDKMTGKATNPLCGQKIKIFLNNKSVEAKIMDLCVGCPGPYGLDLSHAAWKALTGTTVGSRYQGSWSKI